MARRALCGAAALALLALPAASQEGPGPAIVHLADGSTVPLNDWTFSYEYAAWAQGTSPTLAATARKDARELYVGKKAHATAGIVLEVQWQTQQREQEVDGETRKVPVSTPRGLVAVQGGKKTALKPEAPHRGFLMPEGGKGQLYQARSLDFRGSTLTGTRRDFCLLTYSSLVECAATPGNTVVRIEFPK